MRCGPYRVAASGALGLCILSPDNDRGVRWISSFHFSKFDHNPPLGTIVGSTAADRTEHGEGCLQDFPPLVGGARGGGTPTDRWKHSPLSERGVRGDLAAFIHTGLV